ncbi:hypothetical protein [Absidia glauca]|uniref:C2H2-type domain-containing protein n=1 Tax=Absidia glauca TaxID=4829 RepID=A0A168PWU3_ABSGL|nr:hypothetical protein [Absidia glauca]
MEEDSLTTTTTSHISSSDLLAHHEETLALFPCKTAFRRSSSGFRCDSCQRRFHSIGNLSNHQQLYQH